MKHVGAALTALLSLSLCALHAQPARAQFIAPMGTGYMGADSLQYNSMQGAFMSHVIKNMQSESFARQALLNSYYRTLRYRRSGPSPAQLQAARGRRLIKSGRATVAFPMRPFPLDTYLKGPWSGNGDPVVRKRNYDEWIAQKQIWQDEMRARGAKPGDMSHMIGLAFVMCAEAYNGKGISNDGFRAKVADVRKLYRGDAPYQGLTVVQKQQHYEDAMLSATYAMYLRRTGNIQKAREVAGKFLDQKWNTDHKGVADADDAVNWLARWARKTPPASASRSIAPASDKPVSLADTAEPSASEAGLLDAPEVPFDQAVRLTNYTPVAPTLLPEQFAMVAKGIDPEAVRKFEDICRQAIVGTQGDLRKVAGSELPVENVARAMTYALVQLYTVSMLKTGQPPEEAARLTPESVSAVRRQFAVALASDPGFRKLSNREKQEAAESMLLVPCIAGVLYVAGLEDSDQAAMKEAQTIARRMFESLFAKAPSKVRITARGLEPMD